MYVVAMYSQKMPVTYREMISTLSGHLGLLQKRKPWSGDGYLKNGGNEATVRNQYKATQEFQVPSIITQISQLSLLLFIHQTSRDQRGRLIGHATHAVVFHHMVIVNLLSWALLLLKAKAAVSRCRKGSHILLLTPPPTDCTLQTCDCDDVL